MMRSSPHVRRRSDGDIFVDARRALDLRPGVPAGVHVHVEHGIVTLTGTARTPAERADAEDAVRSVAGWERLINEIVVPGWRDNEGFGPPDAERG